MRVYKQISLLCLLLSSGCAASNPGRVGRAPVSAAQAPEVQHCPDRLDKARAGGLIGTVVGTVVASLTGSPILGLLYRAGGYGAGFSSAEACLKGKPPAVAAQSRSDTPPVPSGKIIEEDIK